MSGWIKLHRQLIEWEWYTEPNTFRLFMHCLLRANHSDSKWRGRDIKRGQFITSVDTLMAELELSRSKVRTALKNLESTNEIAMSISTRSRVVTVLQYDSYQDLATTSPSDDHEIAMRSPTDRQPIATDKNVKNDKKKKNKDNTLDELFEKAWIMYGKKGNHKSSSAKFSKLKDSDRLDIINHIPLYVLSTPEKKYRKNFETYLNQHVWKDEVQNDEEDRITQYTGKPSTVDIVRESARRRQAERLASSGISLESDGSFVGENDRDIRQQVHEPIRNGAKPRLDSRTGSDHTGPDETGA